MEISSPSHQMEIPKPEFYVPTGYTKIFPWGHVAQTQDRLQGCRILAGITNKVIAVCHHGPGHNNDILASLQPSFQFHQIEIWSLAKDDYLADIQQGGMRMDYKFYTDYLAELVQSVRDIFSVEPTLKDYNLNSTLRFWNSDQQLLSKSV